MSTEHSAIGYKFAKEIEIQPMQSEAELESLINSIVSNGFDPLFPIVVYGNEIFDGRNRYRAATRAKVEPVFFECDSRDEAIGIAYKAAMQRSQTPDQKLMVLSHLANLKDGVRADRAGVTNGTPKTTAEVAKDAGASEAKAKKAVSLKNKVEDGRADQSLSDSVASGDHTIRDAYETTRILDNPEDQRKAVEISKETGDTLTKIAKSMTGQHSDQIDNEWYTPPEFIQSAKKVMGVIGTDPASCWSAQRTVGAINYFTKEDNGLERDWAGTVWINPPYEPKLNEAFALKLIDEMEVGNVTEAIVLNSAKTDTAWFQSYAGKANAICLKKGRISFLKDDGIPVKGNGQGSVFFYFGDNVEAFLNEFSQYGVAFDCSTQRNKQSLTKEDVTPCSVMVM